VGLKAQLLVKINNILKPKFIPFEDYAIRFTIPRVHTKPTDLDDEEVYNFMTGRLQIKDSDVSVS
jgi:hypothetical protein